MVWVVCDIILAVIFAALFAWLFHKYNSLTNDIPIYVELGQKSSDDIMKIINDNEGLKGAKPFPVVEGLSKFTKFKSDDVIRISTLILKQRSKLEEELKGKK